MLRWCRLLLAACGRLGFDAHDGGATDAPGDGSRDSDVDIDAPPGAITRVFTLARDTFISNETGEPGFNYGGDDEIRLERDAEERGLISFDITNIPSSATIFDVSLAVTVTQIPLAPSPINVHQLLELWDEGTLAGTAGIANFTMRIATDPWTNPGAAPPTSATSTITAAFTPVIGRMTVPLPDALVQGWVQTPSTNNGIVLISTNDESTRLTTSEGFPLGDRPMLTVTFVP